MAAQHPARWRSGYAAACKAVYTGSIPVRALAPPVVDCATHPGCTPKPRSMLERPDASGTSIAKARRLLGYAPSRSWRDYLDPDTGALLPEAADRLERGDTGVQRGRRALG